MKNSPLVATIVSIFAVVDAQGFTIIDAGDCVATGLEQVNITYSSDTDIYGFQFVVEGAELLSASGTSNSS